MMITASGPAVMYVIMAPSNTDHGCDRNKPPVSGRWPLAGNDRRP